MAASGSPGAGSGSGLLVNTQATLFTITGGIHNRARFFVSGNNTFKVLIEITDDAGVTHFAAHQIASAVVEADLGSTTYVNGAMYEGALPSLGRVIIESTTGTLAYKYDYVLADATVIT